ncbi:ATP-binding cassette domain-containing protein [Kribbella sp. NBC_01245]|uniref:ribosomal protection-like ABC-F family protein n=1 Tax=Kribbella sp. NBC_01245 TaxID=2903578 RepID=UPI002E27DB12|nr:ABC-F family ATP-binding cassette domain-containing protein [Kribbella sp. NBC_01245]
MRAPLDSHLTLTEVTVRHPDHLVLDRVTLSIRPGEKVGVVGENGSGKSTLLRLIAGLQHPTDGEVSVAAPGGIGHLAQALDLPGSATVADVIDHAMADLRMLEREIAAAEADLQDLDAYGDLLTAYEQRGGYEADSRVDAALHGLGLPGLRRDRLIGTMSGGQRARLALAAMLASSPELILLDEPTNHLDDDAITWLEQHLRRFKGTVVAVTHDRAFLDAVTSTVFEVDADTHAVRRYGDGYAGLLRAKASARQRWHQRYDDWVAEVARHTELADRATDWLDGISRKSAKDGSGASHMRSSATNTANRIRNAREHLRRLEADPVPRPPEPLVFSSPLAGALAGGLELDGVVLGSRLRVPELSLKAGERLLVTGPNGAGKTTLLRILAGDLTPDHGDVRRSGRVGFFRQDDGSPGAESVLTRFAAGRRGLPEEHREELLSLGLFRAEDLAKPMAALSIGQRRRVDLARLITRPVDLLLLDEPTNHLSPALVDELEQALVGFGGVLVLVTHDRSLRSTFAGRTLHLNAGQPAQLAA